MGAAVARMVGQMKRRARACVFVWRGNQWDPTNLSTCTKYKLSLQCQWRGGDDLRLGRGRHGGGVDCRRRLHAAVETLARAVRR